MFAERLSDAYHVPMLERNTGVRRRRFRFSREYCRVGRAHHYIRRRSTGRINRSLDCATTSLDFRKRDYSRTYLGGHGPPYTAQPGFRFAASCRSWRRASTRGSSTRPAYRQPIAFQQDGPLIDVRRPAPVSAEQVVRRVVLGQHAGAVVVILDYLRLRIVIGPVTAELA